MEKQRDRLIAWVKDAYGMEESQLQMLDRFIADFRDNEAVRSQLEQHKTLTESQRMRLQECLERFDEKPSTLKGAAGSLMGMIQGMSTALAKDEKMKDMLMIFAGENFEYGTYLATQAAADELNEMEVAKTAQDIADEEKATADWAQEQIPLLAHEQLSS